MTKHDGKIHQKHTTALASSFLKTQAAYADTVLKGEDGWAVADEFLEVFYGAEGANDIWFIINNNYYTWELHSRFCIINFISLSLTLSI